MGRGWALVDLASRLSRQKERAEAVAMAADIFAEAPARVGGARPLLALGALARRDALSQMKDRRVGAPGRQLRMFRALRLGRGRVGRGGGGPGLGGGRGWGGPGERKSMRWG